MPDFEDTTHGTAGQSCNVDRDAVRFEEAIAPEDPEVSKAKDIFARYSASCHCIGAGAEETRKVSAFLALKEAGAEVLLDLFLTRLGSESPQVPCSNHASSVICLALKESSDPIWIIEKLHACRSIQDPERPHLAMDIDDLISEYEIYRSGAGGIEFAGFSDPEVVAGNLRNTFLSLHRKGELDEAIQYLDNYFFAAIDSLQVPHTATPPLCENNRWLLLRAFGAKCPDRFATLLETETARRDGQDISVLTRKLSAVFNRPLAEEGDFLRPYAPSPHTNELATKLAERYSAQAGYNFTASVVLGSMAASGVTRVLLEQIEMDLRAQSPERMSHDYVTTCAMRLCHYEADNVIDELLSYKKEKGTVESEVVALTVLAAIPSFLLMDYSDEYDELRNKTIERLAAQDVREFIDTVLASGETGIVDNARIFELAMKSLMEPGRKSRPAPER